MLRLKREQTIMTSQKQNFTQAVRERVAEVVVGQDVVVERMMIALLTGGHLLLLGVPASIRANRGRDISAACGQLALQGAAELEATP